MDIKFSAEDVAFRHEVKEFFAAEYDGAASTRLGSDPAADYKSDIVAWQKKLHAKGWIAPGWPKEYGGTGWTSTQKFIYETERGLAGIPDVVTVWFENGSTGYLYLWYRRAKSALLTPYS